MRICDCPMGPIAVTANEVDVANLDVRCWANGELRQNANTRDLIFDVATIIETLSAGITLFPGDIIATGTSFDDTSFVYTIDSIPNVGYPCVLQF
jgi:2-keto-4-pentenoate hydratase/2-oxohepta-3-ene-1,7-dioic acid hydratase in catechol pathway